MKHEERTSSRYLSWAIKSLSFASQFPGAVKISLITKTLFTAVSVLLVFQFFAFIGSYASDLLFSDQWDFYRPLILQKNFWETFSWQHGPHRQGIGLVVTQRLAEWTHFDARADAFAVGLALLLALGLALFLKYRLFGRITLYDLALPLLFLSLFQFEALVLVPNLSHGAMPILLMILYVLSLLIQKPWLRYSLLLVLNFMLIYTGFGVFMGIITLVLFAVEAYQRHRDHLPMAYSLIAFTVAVVSGLSFFIDYRFFQTAAICSSLEIKYIPQYPVFMSLMLANPVGWNLGWVGWLAYPLGGALLVLSGIVLFLCSRRLWKIGLYQDRAYLVIVILLGYSFLFCFNAAIGRSCLGLSAAQSSRYIPLLIPAFLALYFYLLRLHIKGRLPMVVLSIYVVLLSAGSLPLGIIDKAIMPYYSAKANWKACYVRYQNVRYCNEVTGFQPYPNADVLESELRYFKTQQLNIFMPQRK